VIKAIAKIIFNLYAMTMVRRNFTTFLKMQFCFILFLILWSHAGYIWELIYYTNFRCFKLWNKGAWKQSNM